MEEMKLIDFNGRFRRDYLNWCAKHQDIANDEERIDELFYTMYTEWFRRPKQWLQGKTPEQYFEEIGDPRMYVTMMIEYIKEDMELPDPLVTCMEERKAEVYPIIRNILFADREEEISEDALEEVQSHIISLISEMDLAHPYERYIGFLRNKTEESSLLDEASYALLEAEHLADYRESLLDAYRVAAGYGKLCLLDILSSFEGDGEIYDILAEEFQQEEADKGFLAGCLGKLGDSRAIPLLERELERSDLEYMLYRELREAVEMLGGDEVADRDFTGDRDYDFLAGQGWDDEDEQV